MTPRNDACSAIHNHAPRTLLAQPSALLPHYPAPVPPRQPHSSLLLRAEQALQVWPSCVSAAADASRVYSGIEGSGAKGAGAGQSSGQGRRDSRQDSWALENSIMHAECLDIAKARHRPPLVTGTLRWVSNESASLSLHGAGIR